MKNIHVLPTPNPSRIISSNKEFTLLKNYTTDKRCQNSYITSNEEIGTDEYYFHLKNNEYYNSGKIDEIDKDMKFWRKIILTTDQDLIKDGVQAIDDEFLEWFVKNPSCEFVKTERYKTIYHTWIYKIIIPKEDFDFDKLHYKETFESRQYYIPKEEPKPLKKIIMKNIHILPTPKLSILGFDSVKNLHFVNDFIDDYQNISITNDEEIKVGNWVLYTKGIKIHYIKITNSGDEELANIKDSGVFKIILTTDQELIQDGVQAIDDEFLEWFVKNSNCEYVEVKSEILYEHKDTYRPYPSDCKNLSKTKVNYYLSIIPKEEWKCCGAFYGCDKCEHKKELRGIPKGKIDTVVGKPKQSTKDRILYETPESIKQKVRETANKLVKPKQEPKPFKDMQQLTEVDLKNLNKSLKKTIEDKKECECTDECLGYLTKECKKIGAKREFVINTSKWNLEDFEETKDLTYYRANAEEDYMKVPISVLRYISELEKRSYSEEEVLELLTKAHFVEQNIVEWFYRNKKK